MTRGKRRRHRFSHAIDGDHARLRRGGGEEREAGAIGVGGRVAFDEEVGGAHGEGGVDVRDVVLSAHRATHRAVAQGRTADRVGKGAARGAQSTHGASGGVGGARQGYASETRKVSSGLQR